MYKRQTQVFISPEGDHYRTRLTHTLEACGIARNVARALGLNEDLTEAIGLGHDLGHPPFGHIGEAVLDDCVRSRWGHAFRHNEHSLRVVDRIERLNLTEQVRDGILRHTGAVPPASLEGRIVRVVDRIVHSKAFRRLNHKTQVFIAPEGDHYRTRLTHTLETTQISRTVGRLSLIHI